MNQTILKNILQWDPAVGSSQKYSQEISHSLHLNTSYRMTFVNSKCDFCSPTTVNIIWLFILLKWDPTMVCDRLFYSCHNISHCSLIEVSWYSSCPFIGILMCWCKRDITAVPCLCSWPISHQYTNIQITGDAPVLSVLKFISWSQDHVMFISLPEIN